MILDNQKEIEPSEKFCNDCETEWQWCLRSIGYICNSIALKLLENNPARKESV